MLDLGRNIKFSLLLWLTLSQMLLSCKEDSNSEISKKEGSLLILETSSKSCNTASLSNSDKWTGLSTPSSIPLLLIMIDFTGAPTTLNTQDETYWSNRVFNDPDGVNSYFNEISYNYFSFLKAAESWGLADGVIKVSLPRAHPNPGAKGLFHYVLQEALDQADNNINFASFDSNVNGVINPRELQIMFIVAGSESAAGGSSPPSVWAHAWSICGQEFGIGPLFYDGKRVACPSSGDIGSGYSRFGAEQWGHDATIGVMVHELGHAAFGLPDMYDADSSSDGIGGWGVMGAGAWAYKSAEFPGKTPVHASAWSKMKLGWRTVNLNPFGMQNIDKSTTDNSLTNIIKLSIGTYEYLLVENRKYDGFDKGIEGLIGSAGVGGLAIWHVDDRISDNNNENCRILDLQIANGSLTDHNNLFYSGNKSTYSGYSKNITSISSAGNTMTASF